MDDRIIGRIPRSVEMRTPAIVSAMLHVVVLGAAVMNLDFFNRPPLMEPEPVMVDFEMIDKKAAAPKVGNPPPQPKDVPIAEEATKALRELARAGDLVLIKGSRSSRMERIVEGLQTT